MFSRQTNSGTSIEDLTCEQRCSHSDQGNRETKALQMALRLALVLVGTASWQARNTELLVAIVVKFSSCCRW
jgi:hypothetical protein